VHLPNRDVKPQIWVFTAKGNGRSRSTGQIPSTCSSTNQCFFPELSVINTEHEGRSKYAGDWCKNDDRPRRLSLGRCGIYLVFGSRVPAMSANHKRSAWQGITMWLPPSIYAIRRMPPRLVWAWSARHCEWCEEKPTCTIHYRLPLGNKTCSLMCEAHAREASERIGLHIEL
jgi:hypothetical protein